MNKIKKIIFAASIVITIAIASIATFATELSQTIVNQCTNYINNPSEKIAKENADALNQCNQNDVCQKQLSSLKNCTKTLSHWYMSYSPTQTKTETPTTQLTTATKVAPTTQQTAQPPAVKTIKKENENKPSGINWF